MTRGPGKPSVLMVIPSLAAGGAEAVMAALADAFAVSGWAVALMTLMGGEPPDHPHVSPEVERLRLDRSTMASHAMRLVETPWAAAGIRRILRERRPDVVLSFLDLTNFQVLLAARGLGIPVVVSERMDPQFHRWAALRAWMRNRLYRRAAAIVVQTARIRDALPVPLRERTVVIANPMPAVSEPAAPERPDETGRFRVVAVARLHRQKGLDRLIGAFSSLAADFPAWDLHIFGEGAEEVALRRQATAGGAAGRIAFRGVTRDVWRELRASHLFAFPSRYEGFPNALAEAVAHGLPAVGFRDVSGVGELIVDGENGFLVDPGGTGPASLAGRLAVLMGDGSLRAEMGRRGRALLADRFAVSPFELWHEVVQSAAFSSGR